MARFSAQSFRTRFHDNLLRRRLVAERGTVIVAVSGGIDSMVLLDLLARERESLGLTLSVAHFNHQLRGSESGEDEEFVEARAREYGLEFYVERADTAEHARLTRLGVQEAARNLRYDFFQKLLLSSGFGRIATAHNADDNAETVLLNLVRGAGVAGLSGIPVFRKDRSVIRPLLFAERDEIQAFAETERLPFRIDSSNEKDLYNRNLVRHQVLPVLKEHINPGLVGTLLRTSDLFRELETYLAYDARQRLDLVATQRSADEIHLSIPGLRGIPTLMRQYVVLLAAESLTRRRPEYDQVQRILDLMDGMTGSWVPLSEAHAVFRDRDSLVFRSNEELADFRIVIQQNHRYDLGRFTFSSELLTEVPPFREEKGVEFVDADKLRPGDLVLRTWVDGDEFMPLGMKAMKKVSDFFVDARIPMYAKRRYPILETPDGQIVWVCGQRIDERFKVTDDTQRVLRLEFAQTGENGNGGTNKG